MNPTANPNQQQFSPADQEAFLKQLRQTLAKLPHEIHLYLFSKPGSDDMFTQSIRQVVRAFRELTDKIVFREYELGHELARKWNVDQSPTLLFEPDKYAIRWMGAPIGEEGRTFIELLFFVGLRQSNLSDQALKVINQIDSPRHIKVFVSPSCPYCPYQVTNAVKAVIEKPELISLDIIDIQVQPELANQYSAHSVPQAFANDTLIAMGAQPEELFMLSLKNLEEERVFIPDSDAPLVETDLLIVGGGPAGLTAAIYAIRSGMKAAVVERAALGGQVALTPSVENYPGFTQVGGKALVEVMVNHALQYCPIYQGEEVIDISDGPPFEVTTSRRRFTAQKILLATGASHKKLGVPGEKRLSGRGVSYCATCDGPLFKGKKVIVVGGGNSAATEALHLHHIGVDVTLIHRRDTLRAQEFLARNLRENQIPILWNTEVKEIRGQERVEEVLLINNQTQQTQTMPANGVFLAIGYVPSVALAQKVGIALNEDGYIKRDEKHRTNIAGIYSAGDVEGGYKQIVTASGQGAEAAMSIFEDMMNPYWKYAQPQTLNHSRT